MLKQETFDGVVIAASHEAHYDMAKAALEHGCHILIEKPMVLKTEEAKELIELANRNQRIIVMSYPWGYTPHVRRARQAVLSGELGEVELISSLFTSFAYASYLNDPEALDEIYSGDAFEPSLVRPRLDANVDPNRGGGQGYVQVTHSAALAFWVTGLVPRRVSAYMSHLDTAVDVVDAVSMRLDNGAVGVLSSTGHLRVGDPGQHTLWVYGSLGYLILDLIAGTLTIHKFDGTTETPEPVPPDDRYPRFAPAANFVEVILYGAENLAPGEVGQLAVNFLDAAYRSAANGGAAVDVEN
jgi:predicted dehydrogenase